MRISEFRNGDLQIEGDDGDLVIVEGTARFVPTRDSHCPCGGSLDCRPATDSCSETYCLRCHRVFGHIHTAARAHW